MAKELTEAFCPICGRGMSEKHSNHMLTMVDDEKHFGIVRQTGYGGFGKSKYIEDSYNPGFFDKLKTLFLAAIAVWLEKGWIKKEDLKNLIK